MSDANADPKTETERESVDDGSTTATRVRRGLDYALLGGLVLLGVFAAIQFYLAADRTINVWVTREYRPPFKMVFNLVVLLVVGIGVSRQVRRLTGSNGGEDGSGSDGDTDSEVATDGGIDSADASPFVDETTVAEMEPQGMTAASRNDEAGGRSDAGEGGGGNDTDEAGGRSDANADRVDDSSAEPTDERRRS